MSKTMQILKTGGGLALLAALTPGLALAQEAAKPALDSGDTAWMLTSTALVLFMTCLLYTSRCV